VDKNANVVEAFDYYPFGAELRSTVNDNQAANLRFTGKELDKESHIGLYYFGERYYDPSIGRFISVDPMTGTYPGLSPYNYCANNPIILVDPTGAVIETTEDDLNSLRQTLPQEADSYIALKNGQIDTELLNQASIDDVNFQTIQELSNSDEIYNFSRGNEIVVLNNGKETTYELADEGQGLSGLTLEKEISKSGMNEIIVSDQLKGKKLVKYISHELGHALLLDRSRKNNGVEWLHKIEYDEKLGGHTDKNTQLKILQSKLIKNATKNYNTRKRNDK
jgi:RHS repeat-associated protein